MSVRRWQKDKTDRNMPVNQNEKYTKKRNIHFNGV